MRTIALTLATSALMLGTASNAGAAVVDPNEKTTVTDIQWRIVYSTRTPGNCMVAGFSQWEAAKFKGWDAYKLSITFGTPPASSTYSASVSPPPLYDDQLPYHDSIVSPPNGSHWALIGDGSFRAGPPPAEADCQAMLARSQAQIPDNKVTTYFRRTTVCATKFDKLTKAEKGVKKAKGKKSKRRAKAKLAAAKSSFTKDCTR